MTEALQPPADTNWAEAVRRLARASLLVVGDLLLDRYVFGEVARVSPEAPVPVLTVAREVALPGGAGNVVRNLTAIGAAVAFVSIVGDDQNGSDLTGLIGGQPGVEPWILVQGGRLTTVKSRFIAQGQQLFRADKEDPSPVHAKLAERMIRIAHDAMAATDITVLTDYGQGLLADDVAPQLIGAVRSLGRRVVVDPGMTAAGLARFAGADVLVPGRRLLAELTGDAAPTDDTLIQAAAALRAAHGFGAVLVFGAKDGLLLVSDAGAAHFPTEAAEYYDVLGARDAVLGTLAAALGIGQPLAVAARLAALAGGVVIGKAGNAVARSGDLLAALSPMGSALRKVVTCEAAEEQVERWRQRGLRVGFTGGAFDLLHPGHVRLLEQARAHCDRLVVGLDADTALRRARGQGRAAASPGQNEAARAAELAALSVVDLVVVVEDDTPETLLRALRPDVVVTGGVPGRGDAVAPDWVHDWGGRVVLADLLPEPAVAATVTRLRG